MPTRGGRGPDKPAPHREALPAGTLLQGGAFRILDVIGAGGFSLTYIAEERSRRIQVAIKEMFPSGCVRNGIRGRAGTALGPQELPGRAEGSSCGKVRFLKFFNHPSIVQCYSPFEENGTAYMAMVVVERRALPHQLGHARHESAPGFGSGHSTRRRLGLTFMRAALFILISSPKTSSLPRKASSSCSTLGCRVATLPAGLPVVVVISPGYSPPEQYQASKALTPATDIYSLAATLYTLLSLTVLPEAPLREKGVAIRLLRDVNPTVTAPFSVAIEQALEPDPQTPSPVNGGFSRG